MKDILLGILFIIFIIVFGCLIGWMVEGNNFFMYKFWAPKYEQTRRETYEQTKSYRQGNTQRLNTLCMQYNTADEDHKTMIGDVINQEFAEANSSDYPSYLRSCLSDARH